MNRVKTVMLLATLTAVLLWARHALGGHSGIVMALVMAGFMNVGAYWWSDQLIIRMYGAQEVTEAQTPELYTPVQALARRARLPILKRYVIPEAAPNAFAGNGASGRALSCMRVVGGACEVRG